MTPQILVALGWKACGFTGLSSPGFLVPGDWKVARTCRLESLRYVVCGVFPANQSNN